MFSFLFWKTFVFLEFSLLENLVNTERLCTFAELLLRKVLLLHSTLKQLFEQRYNQYKHSGTENLHV